MSATRTKREMGYITAITHGETPDLRESDNADFLVMAQIVQAWSRSTQRVHPRRG